MEEALTVTLDPGERRSEQNLRISEVIQREGQRLLHFIRKRVDDEGDAEDILQEVFYELIETYRMMKPVEQVGAWLFRVARNRIIDRFRKRKPDAVPLGGDDPDARPLEDLLPSPDAGPDAVYARGVLLDELDAALAELPEDQRSVFVAHEIDGQSYKQLAKETGVSVNTLLSRKRYAIVYLRRRLQAIYEQFQS